MISGNYVPIEERVVVIMDELTADNLLVVLRSLSQYGAQPQADRMVDNPRHPVAGSCWAHPATTEKQYCKAKIRQRQRRLWQLSLFTHEKKESVKIPTVP